MTWTVEQIMRMIDDSTDLRFTGLRESEHYLAELLELIGARYSVRVDERREEDREYGIQRTEEET